MHKKLLEFGSVLAAPYQSVFLTQIANKIEVVDTCWIFYGSLSHKGYGLFRLGGRKGKVVRVHRWMWQARNGDIPSGLMPDHLCRKRNCCNPSHLEIVTSRVNTFRGIGVAVVNAQKVSCPQGHFYSPENTLTYSGRRRCHECQLEHSRRWKKKVNYK